jgi:hypothetical protein
VISLLTVRDPTKHHADDSINLERLRNHPTISPSFIERPTEEKPRDVFDRTEWWCTTTQNPAAAGFKAQSLNAQAVVTSRGMVPTPESELNFKLHALRSSLQTAASQRKASAGLLEAESSAHGVYMNLLRNLFGTTPSPIPPQVATLFSTSLHCVNFCGTSSPRRIDPN